MKLRADIAGESYSVDFRPYGSRVITEIDNRRYELDVHESGPQEFLLIDEGQVFDCRVEGRPESGKTIDVIVGTDRYAIAITDPKRLRGSKVLDTHAIEAAHIVAPMPGKVVRVLVDVGEQIDAGAGIMVVEAMKMQNEMRSPKAGVVVALNVQVGATVNRGEVLAVVE